MIDDLIVHNENFQEYKKIIIVDDNEKPIFEYTLTQIFGEKK